MKRISRILLTVAMSGTMWTAVAQTSAPAWSPSTLDALRQLQSAALRDDYGYERLAHLADNIGPRPVGSLQASAAVDYVAAELRKLGFDVRLERVRVPRWIRGEDRCELVQYSGQVPGTTQKIVVTALGGLGVSTSRDGITAEVLIVRSLAELAALPRDRFAGKIVLFYGQFDSRMAESGFAFDAYDAAVEPRNNGRSAAEKAGAAAVLVRSVGGAQFRLVHVGATDYFNSAHIPAAAITAEDADLIVRLSSQGPVRLHLVLTSDLHEEVDSYNVIADLRGSEHPEQIVIVSGHLDSWDLGTGALDDGAGVAIALATAHPSTTKRFGQSARSESWRGWVKSVASSAPALTAKNTPARWQTILQLSRPTPGQATRWVSTPRVIEAWALFSNLWQRFWGCPGQAWSGNSKIPLLT